MNNTFVYDIFLVLGPLVPLIAGAGLFMFGWAFGRRRWLYQSFIFAMALSGLVCQIGLAFGFGEGTRTPYLNLFRWSPVPDFAVDVAFRGDLLSFFFGLPLSALSFLLVAYLLVRQPGPERGDGIERGRIYGLLLMAEGTALAAFYSADLVLLWGWLEALGLCFYLLAGPGLRGASSLKASYQGYSVSLLAGFIILAPLLVIISRNGGSARYDQFSPATVDTLLFTFVVIGTVAKAAQFPFQVIFGEVKNLPAAAHALIGVGTVFPLAIYLPARLQIIAADRVDLFSALGWLYLPVGALTIICAGGLALRESSAVQRTAYLVAGSFGFVVLALGLGNLPAALLQLLGLSVAGPLLFLCADLLQIENAPAPPDPQNAAKSIPIVRPALFRPVLAICYLTGASGVVGLPLTPAYTARWQTLGDLLAANHRLYFGLAVIGLGLMALALVLAFAAFLQQPHNTQDKIYSRRWLPLFAPAGLAGLAAILGIAPTLTSDWLASFTARVPSFGPQRLPNSVLSTGGWFGLVLALSLFAGAALIWRTQKVQPAPAFNGGMLFGAEAEAERKLHLSRNKALVVIEENEAHGFEDEFFKVGLRDMKPPPPKVEPRLSVSDYFAPLLERLTEPYKLLNTAYGGSILGKILIKVLEFIRRIFEWITERFYPALAAFLVLIFIFLLTR